MLMHNPAHPGRLFANYVVCRSITEAAHHLGVTRPTLSRIHNGKAAISADMALRISEELNTEADFWLGLQAQRDVWVASQKPRPRLKPLPALKAA